jgi:hypothetical protein
MAAHLAWFTHSMVRAWPTEPQVVLIVEPTVYMAGTYIFLAGNALASPMATHAWRTAHTCQHHQSRLRSWRHCASHAHRPRRGQLRPEGCHRLACNAQQTTKAQRTAMHLAAAHGQRAIQQPSVHAAPHAQDGSGALQRAVHCQAIPAARCSSSARATCCSSRPSRAARSSRHTHARAHTRCLADLLRTATATVTSRGKRAGATHRARRAQRAQQRPVVPRA